MVKITQLTVIFARNSQTILIAHHFKNPLWDAKQGVLYLKSNIAIMKTGSQTFRIASWVMLGILISLSSLALTRPLPLVQEITITPTPMTTTTIATPEVRPDAGSTDGIMLMAVVIVLIVIVPILLRRKAWSNGKVKR